jgi:hypothetical protein
LPQRDLAVAMICQRLLAPLSTTRPVAQTTLAQ